MPFSQGKEHTFLCLKGEKPCLPSKKLCLCALCIALCCVLPTAFHGLGLGGALSPMHLPVLLCGLICGGWLGAVCGAVGPILSSVITGCPAPPSSSIWCLSFWYTAVRRSAAEAVAHGEPVRRPVPGPVPAMVLGRVMGGAVQALEYLGGTERYSLAMWAGSYFVGTMPGAVLQLVVLPTLVVALVRAGLIPARYPRLARA